MKDRCEIWLPSGRSRGTGYGTKNDDWLAGLVADALSHESSLEEKGSSAAQLTESSRKRQNLSVVTQYREDTGGIC